MTSTFDLSVTVPSLLANGRFESTEHIRKMRKIQPGRRTVLTQRLVEGAKAVPRNGQTFIRDDELSGFALRITETGAKAFVFEGRVKGRPRRITLGRYPEMTVKAARAAVVKLRNQINEGRDPVQERREAHHAPTFKDLVDEYLKDAEARGRKSLPRVKERIDAHLPRWFSRRATDITVTDVTRLHRKLGEERGKVLANRVAALVRAIFNCAIKARIFAGPNPAGELEPFQEHQRERFLSAAEMVRVNEALAGEPNEYWRAYFALTLLLGTRKTELLQARWEDVDLSARTLRLPTTKNGEPHLLPLPEPAISILEKLPSCKAGGWIFPGQSRTGHLVDAFNAWMRIRKRAKVEDVTIHDLRRSLGSWLASQGHSLLLIGKALHHRSSASTQIYARLSLEPLREALDRNAKLMLGSGS